MDTATRVRDEEIPVDVEREASRVRERRGERQPSVTRVARLAGAGDGRDTTRYGVDPADAVVEGIGDEDVAVVIDGDAGRSESDGRVCRRLRKRRQRPT